MSIIGEAVGPVEERRELERSLGAELNALLSASRALTEHSAAAFHPDLQPAAFHLARWLHAYGPTKPSTLAEAVAMDRSSTSRLINRMKTLDLLTSGPDPDDKRSVIIALTADGTNRVRDALDLRGSTLTDRAQSWTNSDLRTFTTLLHAFNLPR